MDCNVIIFLVMVIEAWTKWRTMTSIVKSCKETSVGPGVPLINFDVRVSSRAIIIFVRYGARLIL